MPAAKIFKPKSIPIMNIENFEYLRDQIKYAGFGESLEEKLKSSIENGHAEFKLEHTARFGNGRLDSELNFSRSKQSDMYFFNSYRACLQRDGRQETLEQIFYINKANNITLKEAYNLMSGRSVNKTLSNREGQLYNAWVQLDFKQVTESGNFKLKQFHENYGYSLEDALAKHPIKELGVPEYRANLIESLKKGNLQSVTFRNNGTEEKFHIEANPRFKTVNIYDGGMKRLDNRKHMSQSGSPAQEQGEKKQKAQKENTGTEDESPASQKRRNRRAVSP
ncbi:hypothetical protein LAG90_18090 [Marinilongibacter aquaticus]|uniref:hypothetical protein n=1 Tax=Marinilongibacter aquaticus TaxID=2975157 RepID=UPI0021BD5B74|nr:hypothetical protein [Marinilongibacter aquaticus]UBM58713.1 hypothetical protein LAG90_18090 [Marinilongibacter aquaticus]